jgi:type IV pilus assembly protein PilB
VTSSNGGQSRTGNPARRLGDILVTEGRITAAKLARALRYQRESGSHLGDALLRLGYITEDQLADALAAQKRLRVVALGDVFPDPRAVALLSERFIRTRQVLPVEIEGQGLVLAMVNPLDVLTLDDVRVITGRDPEPVVTTQTAFETAVRALFDEREGRAARSEDTAAPERPDDTRGGLSDEGAEDDDGSAITLVNGILDSALRRKASDVHFEPQAGVTRVRVRVDGVLHHFTDIPREFMAGVASRLKIMGDMDISERRLPQDGRATYRCPDQTVDLRIASVPSVHGEHVTVRLLDETMFDISLEELGMEETELVRFRQALSRPHGEILITGPTGSGKSTTLYAALEGINFPGTKIYTVEDPVERKIQGITQTQVKAGIGLTFARMLRSLVRSDPDVIMIGEIRDPETATICCEAALTGHLVLSTLHTNDAAATIVRLAEMGVPRYLVASSLLCVVAQRLARRLCPHCREEVGLLPASMTMAEKELLGERETAVARARGCHRCYGTGYSGRVGLYEVLPMSRDLRHLILEGAGTDTIRDYGAGIGVTSLRENGLRKVLQQVTTVEEVHRVTT